MCVCVRERERERERERINDACSNAFKIKCILLCMLSGVYALYMWA